MGSNKRLPGDCDRIPIATLLGEMAERSKAAVLKTVEGQPSQGSNPCLSPNYIAAYHRAVAEGMLGYCCIISVIVSGDALNDDDKSIGS
jgi:hypothetical protein